ncbi:MAG TPA: hypothetical protein GXZ90_01135 [Clostridiales bacterium]|nr:hypothetical protein [Clostridiales bacterium]
MHCIFCNKEKLVTDIVYEDELVIAFNAIARSTYYEALVHEPSKREIEYINFTLNNKLRSLKNERQG